MTPRRKRLTIVLAILAGVGIATALATQAFRDNIVLFIQPVDVAAKAPKDRAFRLGGMVTKGSVQRETGSLEVRFDVTDFQKTIPVTYSGVLPDLFREGQGVVVHGRLMASGVFVADEVLAKHDEKYMPPEVAEALKKAPPAPGTP